MVNQAFRIKIAYRSKKEEEEEKIPGIGRYLMGPTKSVLSHSVDNWSVLFCFSNPGLQDPTICRAFAVDQFYPS